jgi:hypothetical protein
MPDTFNLNGSSLHNGTASQLPNRFRLIRGGD